MMSSDFGTLRKLRGELDSKVAALVVHASNSRYEQAADVGMEIVGLLDYMDMLSDLTTTFEQE